MSKPKNVVPMQRRGEAGYLFEPSVQLTIDELLLYSKVYMAWGDRDLGSRENVVALVHEQGATIGEGKRAQMIEHVIEYIDEIHNIGLAMRESVGRA